jgi:hypothetical protein
MTNQQFLRFCRDQIARLQRHGEVARRFETVWRAAAIMKPTRRNIRGLLKMERLAERDGQ